MPTIRETYDLPKRTPATHRFAVFMCAFAGLALVLWLVLPDSPVTVALLVLGLLAIVFAGVGSVLRSREWREPPPSRPTTPPSAS